MIPLISNFFSFSYFWISYFRVLVVSHIISEIEKGIGAFIRPSIENTQVIYFSLLCLFLSRNFGPFQREVSCTFLFFVVAVSCAPIFLVSSHADYP